MNSIIKITDLDKIQMKETKYRISICFNALISVYSSHMTEFKWV